MILSLNQLSKKYGQNYLYADLNFTFERGCYVISGKNGIGKSVLLAMLAGVTHPNAGSISFNQYSVSSLLYKKQLTYVPSAPSFFPMTTGAEFLAFIASLKSESLIDEAIEAYELTPYLNTEFSSLSLGTQKKLFLSTLSIGNSNVILLDEPTNALDDTSKRYLSTKIKQLSQQAIVIIATHDKAFMSGISHRELQLTQSPVTQFAE